MAVGTSNYKVSWEVTPIDRDGNVSTFRTFDSDTGAERTRFDCQTGVISGPARLTTVTIPLLEFRQTVDWFVKWFNEMTYTEERFKRFSFGATLTVHASTPPKYVHLVGTAFNFQHEFRWDQQTDLVTIYSRPAIVDQPWTAFASYLDNIKLFLSVIPA